MKEKLDLKVIRNSVVSVIVPVYNVERYLDRCIKSIRAQTYDNLEIILVDDGSRDKSSQMCDKYQVEDERIKVIHKKNGGLSSARNAGIQISTGKYITFIDSDDWIAENSIEYMVDLLETNHADIVSASYVLAKNENQKVSNQSEVRIMNKDQALEYFFAVGMRSRVSDYSACAKLYRKELFSNIEFPVGTLYEDYTTVVELISKCSVYVKSSKECYFYYQGGTSIIRNCYKRQHDQLISQCKAVCDLVKNENNTIRELAAERLARSYLSLMIKISVYGFDESINAPERKEIISRLTKSVREWRHTLIHSSMPLSRKILLLIICIDYRPLCILRRFMK